MCVVLIEGKVYNPLIETGINNEAVDVDLLLQHIQAKSEFEFLTQNLGGRGNDSKLFPGGPSCVYKGVTVPCFVRFTEGGGMNGKILKDIFATMDKLHLFDDHRKQGRRPFMLLDGHQSRFDLGFLSCFECLINFLVEHMD